MPGTLTVRRTRRCAGSALLAITVFIAIGSALFAGVASLAITHLQRAHTDAAYAAAGAAAEAGINYELWQLTATNTCHVAGSPGTGTLGSAPWAGTFSVADTRTDGSAIATPSSPPNSITIRSRGTVGGVSRTVSITATQGGGSCDYAVFSKRAGTINGNQTIEGSVGTAGTVTVNGSNAITDRVIGLHGSSASATINPPGSYTTQARAAVNWPNVTDVADSKFGANGLAYLQTHNDNALSTARITSGQLNGQNKSAQTVSPAIAGTTISANGGGTLTLVGKPGGANYYLTAATFNGNWTVALDNSAGPINIWCIGSNGSTFVFNGGSAAVSMTIDPARACRLYVGDRCNLTLNGNGEGDYGVYAINPSATGSTVTFNGNNNLRGSVIANAYTFNGTNRITYAGGYFTAPGGGWQFGGDWLEAHPR